MVVLLDGALRVVAAFVARVRDAGAFAAVVLLAAGVLAAAALVVARRAVVFDAVLAGAAVLAGTALVVEALVSLGAGAAPRTTSLKPTARGHGEPGATRPSLPENPMGQNRPAGG